MRESERVCVCVCVCVCVREKRRLRLLAELLVDQHHEGGHVRGRGRGGGARVEIGPQVALQVLTVLQRGDAVLRGSGSSGDTES